MANELARIPLVRQSGSARLSAHGLGDAGTVLAFWQWSASDLLGNTSRGVLAEYIVALALGVDVRGTRNEWAASDLTTPDGVTVQVKSAAYLQSWYQRRLSTISFNVEPRRAWDPDTNTSSLVPKRHSDVYVFALLAHQDKKSVNPLELSQWQFFVLPTGILDRRTRSQHSITLKSLQALAGGGLAFEQLKGAVHEAAGRPTV